MNGQSIIIRELFDKKIDGQWVTSWCEPTGVAYKCEKHVTLSGGRWYEINKRCNSTGKYQKIHPTYIGVTNCFKDFQEFTEWSRCEVGYNLIDTNGNLWSLDKDLINYTDKKYSTHNCMFVPNKINKLIIASNAKRGEFPVGVSINKRTGKFVSSGSFSGKHVWLGTFLTPEDAHRAWQKHKIETIYAVSKEFKKLHPKLYNALLMRASELEYQVKNHVETVII